MRCTRPLRTSLGDRVNLRRKERKNRELVNKCISSNERNYLFVICNRWQYAIPYLYADELSFKLDFLL